ncbi:allophanate hydrolase subunit 2-domain-containing protein [Rhodocollybia butyracea]|uniref:Allophanate hydrolase subunit 2-domain-containing protein n=1 Tax=Rhodocollybia butyracea TaxID=206335 RepID=A0A9P5UG02_9AGAR|nr:allophanate hydrolase subunit 2-domain-containing protein [Rhodocollybia butyracea]
MFEGEKLLIANRGEIALRILRTAKEIGLPTVTIYTPSDALAPHVTLADEAVALLPESGQSEFSTYCAIDKVLLICEQRSITLLHPGYGFLAEDAEFARKVIECGVTWLGPNPGMVRTMGIKHEARRIAAEVGIPVVPGSDGILSDEKEALRVARRVGFPVILKATAGGGGMGLVVCNNEEEIALKFAGASEHAQALFQDPGLFIERYFESVHHIEIQVFGNGQGAVVHLGERECSIQRRHQKIIEESPSPFCISHPGLKKALTDDAVRLCTHIQYGSAGTVEFIVDDKSSQHFFIEMNTRLQVEHPVTEATYSDIDIVKMMIEYGLAERKREVQLFSKTLQQDSIDIKLNDFHAIEVRIYSENPYDNFKPCPGIVQHVDLDCGHPGWLRVESWISTGTIVTPFFDSLLAKIIVTGLNREEALSRMLSTLSLVQIRGPPNNIDYLHAIISDSEIQKGQTITAFLAGFNYVPQAFTVLAAGLETTVQDLPGRAVGLGVPISGPMDITAFKLANILVENNQDVEGLETILVSGMKLALQFHIAAIVAVTGKNVTVEVDGRNYSMWSAIAVPRNAILTLRVDDPTTPGLRTYIAVYGGFPHIPKYLGSKSTSMGLGGYQGRPLIIGDHIAISAIPTTPRTLRALSSQVIPQYQSEWRIYALNGPHNDPEYMLSTQQLFDIAWKVSTSSNRMGIRLESPEKILWARETGGDGGSHPSNILENGYARGTVNINGDTPVILTKEGPDMGGFISLITVASANMWILGQLAPGDTVKFVPLSWNNSRESSRIYDDWLRDVEVALINDSTVPAWPSMLIQDDLQGFNAKVATISPTTDERPQVAFRQAGDSAILVEYGSMCLDLTVRARIHAFELEVKKRGISAINKFCPCVRSTMVHFDPAQITQEAVLAVLMKAENSLPDSVADLKFPGRRLTFPLVLDDKWNKEAILRYMKTSRKKAVYLPSNINYLAYNNGLEDAEAALQKLVESDYLVLGIGFYLACPFLVPIDPRCWMVGQKMNPSRTYTPRGAIGIAGMVSAIYPVESPGGYQLYGRTLPAWQTWGRGADFAPDRPWILQPFDQIHFEVIKEEDYTQLEQRFDTGQYSFKIENCIFSVKDYKDFTESIKEETALFRKKQAAGVHQQEQIEKLLLEEELRDKAASSQKSSSISGVDESKLVSITAPLSAAIWKILVQPGAVIQNEDQVLVILEAMKTEIPVRAGKQHVGLTIESFGKGITEGEIVQLGETLLLLK